MYDTPELAIEAINILGERHGYAVSILRSKRNKQAERYTVYVCCDRGRAFRDRYTADDEDKADRPRIRKTISLIIKCPFALTLRLDRSRNI